MKVSLKYIYEIRDRDGNPRAYFRRNGLNVRLYPDAPDFADAYKKARTDSDKPVKVESALAYPKGTFGALTHAYESSGLFKQQAKATKRELGYMLRRLNKAHALKAVADLTRADILGWQDELADRPGTANNMLRAMKLLLNFAVDRGLRESNPIARLKELKGGEFRAWTEEEHAAFKARWALGTMQRRAYALALYTGQRKGDLVSMRIQQRSGGVFHITQHKTAEVLEIPELPELTRELAAMTPPGMMMLWKEGGAAISLNHFGSMMRDAIRAALGQDTECVFHGLRNSAAKRLADAGRTPHQIAAITGHRTLRMVEKYTRQADQKRLAKSAMHKLGKPK